MTTKPVLDLADAPVHTGSHGDNFPYALRPLASQLGAKAIGANVTTVPPGKAAFPAHHHRAMKNIFSS